MLSGSMILQVSQAKNRFKRISPMHFYNCKILSNTISMTKRVWKYADFLAWFACNYANEWSMGAHWCTLLHSGWSQHDKILLEIKLQYRMQGGGGIFVKGGHKQIPSPFWHRINRPCVKCQFGMKVLLWNCI